MSADHRELGADASATPAVAAWPEIDVSVRYGWALPRWSARSDHPEAGAIHGRGLSRSGAVRSLLRDLRRARDRAVQPLDREQGASVAARRGPLPP